MSHRTARALLATVLLAGLGALAPPTAASASASASAFPMAPRSAAPAAAERPSGSPQDGRIAFVRGDQVFSMSRWGGDVRRLTSWGHNSRPQWSPDGHRLAFVREVDGRRDLWVMASGGSRERAVTTTGDVTSDGATWSPDGRRLAYATTQLVTIGATAPYGEPVPVEGYPSGGYCDEGDDGTRSPVLVDRFLSWSPDGTRIAVLDHSDCYFDDRMDHYVVATGERQQVAASGADCCGYLDWSDLFWGPGSQFGYSERNTGPYGEDVDAPTRIIYPGFRSLDGDTAGAPSPSGAYLALSTSAAGQAVVVRARADGYGRRVLTTGSQPDWQVRPR